MKGKVPESEPQVRTPLASVSIVSQEANDEKVGKPLALMERADLDEVASPATVVVAK